MRKITWVLFLVGMMAMAQVKGNKEIESRTYPVKGLTDLEMGLYANVEIDCSANEEMVITADRNLFNLIDTEVVDGTLKLIQTEWIQPSQGITVKIGMPNLTRLQLSVHETVRIKNVDATTISLMAVNGKIIAEGKANFAGIGAESGTVDAQNLKANQVVLNIWGDGKAIVNATDFLESTLSKDASVQLIGKPKKIKGDRIKMLSKPSEGAKESVEWITFKIKNNSLSRKHFVVRGPKADGSKFGYGFPMMPQAVRKEKWSIGTKVYLKGSLGLPRLLVTIQPEDAGKTIKLFK